VPLLWLSLAFVCGIILGWLVAWPWSIWLALAGLVFFILVGYKIVLRLPAFHRFEPAGNPASSPWWGVRLPYPVLIVALCLGAARYQSTRISITPQLLAWHNDQETRQVIEGVIRAPPEIRDQYTLLTVDADRVRSVETQTFTPVGGRLLARAPLGGDWRYGDRVSLEGWLSTPFANEEFSYRDYLAHQGIYSYFNCGYDKDICVQIVERDQGSPLWSAIFTLRQRAVETIYRLYPDPEASLMAGILLGEEGGIPEPVRQAFKNSWMQSTKLLRPVHSSHTPLSFHLPVSTQPRY
jgi:competence protein ComEC